MEPIVRSQPSFRSDIQAFRALAVTAVVVFHANALWLPGGFLGVDLFFVLSGFIIARQILPAIRERRFSFSDFYLRRVKRLFPALFFTILFTLVGFSAFWPSDRVADLVNSAVASVFSFSNILFWVQSGYFDDAAIQKPLLHIWSLSVEEQFYLVFPALLVLLAALKRASALLILLVLITLSTGLSEYYVHQAPSSAFFLMPHRFFQFLIGALVAFQGIEGLTENPRINTGIFCTSLVIVCAFFVLANESTPLPGVRTLGFSIASAGLIVSGSYMSGASILNSALLQSIGNASYSIYLAHWPATVALAYLMAGRDQVSIGILALLLSCVLGAALYLGIEKPFRRMETRLTLAGAVAAPLLAVLSVCIVMTNALGPTLTASPRPAPRTTGQGTELPHGLRVALIGDSHANMYLDALRGILEPGKGTVTPFVMPGCPPLFGVYKTYERRGTKARAASCREAQASWAKSLAEQRYDLVIMAARWDYYGVDPVAGLPTVRQDFLLPEDLQGERSRDATLARLETALDHTVQQLSVGSRKVVILGQTPVMTLPRVECARRDLDDAACDLIASRDISARYSTLTALLERVSQRQHAVFVNPFDYLCTGETCRIALGGRVLYDDHNHLSRAGATMVVAPAITAAVSGGAG